MHRKKTMDETILIGMSGGVDSTTTALILKEKGYNVVGAMMSIWSEKNQKRLAKSIKINKPSCFSPNKKEDFETAKKMAKKLNIPFYIIDCTKEFENLVLKNFKQEYLSGRTPNPCVLCNNQVKFGAFLDAAKKQGINFNKFATGHYINIEYNENLKRYTIKKGKNSKKDQSYFLYQLTQEQLSKIITPLGNFEKEEIRKIAQKAGLSIYDKPDSQDFFNGDFNELLEVSPKKGNIIYKNGEILGEHQGFWNFTIGQRKGIGIAHSEPLYVIDLRPESNEVVVSEADDTFDTKLKATDINWVSIKKLTVEKKVTIKYRSSQMPVKAILKPEKEDVWVEFNEPQKAITKGQSVVFYDNDLLLGGGIISEVK